MASCDLQASFQRNDTRNPQETNLKKPTINNLAVTAAADQQNYNRLFESAEYQAISKTRLWKEIFFLRELLESKTEMIGKMEGTIQEF